MWIEMHELGEGCVLETEVCIIGAGAAGVTLARQLDAAGVRAVLLESGGRDYDSEVQSLNAGGNEGLPYYRLEDARLRFFGGTTAIWGGRSAALDAIDFERRPWVPDSGWPIDGRELERWYADARNVLELENLGSTREVTRRLGIDLPAFDSARVRYGVWQFDAPPGRFTRANCEDLVRSAHVAIVSHATATHLQAEPSGEALREVAVADLRGCTMRVRARRFVLASGGLENARLLLASDDVHRGGLGNARDHVGRYFMEHPHGRGGRVVTPHPWKLLRWFAVRHRIGGRSVALCLRPGEALQKRRQGLNTAVSLVCRRRPEDGLPLTASVYRYAKHRLEPSRRNRQLWLGSKALSRALHTSADPLRPWLQTKLGRRELYAVLRAEQTPNRMSRVRLGSERDALGQRRLLLDWQLSELDRHGARVAVEAFDFELRRLGLGCVEPTPWLSEDGARWEFDPLVSAHPIGGFHHMGTTRMAESSAYGVVDRDCRVFDVNNLYVAGSSVFPTSGWANPTLTLIALSLRLGAHLVDRVGAGATAGDQPFVQATA